MKNTIIASVSLMMAMASVVHAVEVMPEQAQTAARNWVKLSPQRMDSMFRSAKAQEVETVHDESGRAIYHAVNLAGGGFVVTSGDTRLSPIVAFSTTGSYSGEGNGPLATLLKKRLSREVSSLGKSSRVYASSGATGHGRVSAPMSGRVAEAMAEWDSLLATGETADAGRRLSGDPGGSAKATLSDVRVGPLLKTKWWQGSTWRTYDVEDGPYIYTYSDPVPTFNYYTPNNYVCGCVATAGAQVMYYWKAPSGSIAQFSNTCYVDYVATTKSSIAGAFDWNNMFATWPDEDNPPTEVQRQAVGKLMYNVGVAVGMSWTGGGSSASLEELVRQLKSRFGYKSGNMIWYDIEALNMENPDPRPSDFTARLADFKNALYASLDAKMPVFMAVNGEDENGYGLSHAVVADGYGYDSGKRYTHVNFGYSTWGFRDENVWYYMPDDSLENYYDYSVYGYDEVESECYSEFEGLGFNVHPTLTGDVISGRVLSSSGSPVSGATVTLYNSSGNSVKTSSTDAKGIYSLRVTSSGSYTVKAVSGNMESQAKSVSIPALSVDGSYGYNGCKTGNRWGNDLAVNKTVGMATVVFDANGGKFSNGASTKTVEAKTGNLWGKLPMPSLSGQVFDGFYTAKSGGTKITASSAVPAASATYYARWTKRLGLAAASEWPYEFTTDSWCGQGAASHDGTDALRSGIIYDNQSSYLMTKVTGAGTLTFWWAVSSESGNDALRFLVDGVQKGVISGEKGWAKMTVAVAGAGTHTLKWNYAKNGSVTKGEDFAWVDQVSWTPDASSQVVVTFDANGGKFSNGATTKTVANPKNGNLWGKLYMPSMSGQVFVGWYTAKTGGTLVTSSSVVPTATTTYYARWTKRLGLAAASEWSGEFTTDSWCGQGAVSHDGTDALRSGIIYDGQNSYLQTKVNGSGTFTFWWKVSCEAGGNDALRFLVDGVQKGVISGEKGWAKMTVSVTGAGAHTLKWNYVKNSSVTKGEDFAWVDQISWSGN